MANGDNPILSLFEGNPQLQAQIEQLMSQSFGTGAQQPSIGPQTGRDVESSAATPVGRFRGSGTVFQTDPRTPFMQALEQAAAPMLFQSLLNPMGFAQEMQGAVGQMPMAGGANDLLGMLLGQSFGQPGGGGGGDVGGNGGLTPEQRQTAIDAAQAERQARIDASGQQTAEQAVIAAQNPEPLTPEQQIIEALNAAAAERQQRALEAQATQTQTQTDASQQQMASLIDVLTQISGQREQRTSTDTTSTTDDPTSDPRLGRIEDILANMTMPEGITFDQVRNIVNESVGSIQFPEQQALPDFESILQEQLSSLQMPQQAPRLSDIEQIISQQMGSLQFPESQPMPDFEGILQEQLGSLQFPQSPRLSDIEQIISQQVGGIDIPEPSPLPDFQGIFQQELGGLSDLLMEAINSTQLARATRTGEMATESTESTTYPRFDRIQALATGGAIDPTRDTLVGEAGPELIPAGSNQVIPLGDPQVMFNTTATPQGPGTGNFPTGTAQGAGTGVFQRLLEQNPEMDAFNQIQGIVGQTGQEISGFQDTPLLGAAGGELQNRVGQQAPGFQGSPLLAGAGQQLLGQLGQTSPEQQVFQQAQDFTGGLLDEDPGAGVISAMQPAFQQNLDLALGRLRNIAPNVHGTGIATQGTDLASRALNDFNLQAAQAAQQGQQTQLAGLGQLGQLAGQAGQAPFQRALGAGQLGLGEAQSQTQAAQQAQMQEIQNLLASGQLGLQEAQALTGAQQQADMGQMQNLLSGGQLLSGAAGQAGMAPFQRALGAGQFGLTAQQQAFEQMMGPTMALLMQALGAAGPTGLQTGIVPQ